jgi:hypothetical protein
VFDSPHIQPFGLSSRILMKRPFGPGRWDSWCKKNRNPFVFLDMCGDGLKQSVRSGWLCEATADVMEAAVAEICEMVW